MGGQADLDDGLTTDDRDELRRLRRENRQLRLEREIPVNYSPVCSGDRRVFGTQPEACMAIFEYIKSWYNPQRRDPGLGYLSRLNFERSNNQSA